MPARAPRGRARPPARPASSTRCGATTWLRSGWVYDPNWYNDRLLLVPKGTMSEGRAASDQAADGFWAAGQGRLRGSWRSRCRPSGEAALDPADEQVQAVIRLVFGLAGQLGTVHAVLRFLVEHQVRIGM